MMDPRTFHNPRLRAELWNVRGFSGIRFDAGRGSGRIGGVEGNDTNTQPQPTQRAMTNAINNTATCPCCDRSVKIVETKSWGRKLAKHGYQRHNAQMTDGCPGSYLQADDLLSSAIEKAQIFIDWDETTDEAREKVWRPLLAKLRDAAPTTSNAAIVETVETVEAVETAKGPSAVDLAYEAAEDALSKLKHQLRLDGGEGLSDQAQVIAGLESALGALNRSRRA